MKSISKTTLSLFGAVETLCRGRPHKIEEAIGQVRRWMGKDRSERPSGYMNTPKFFSGYAGFHLPLHLPELFWILEQNKKRLNLKAPKIIRDLGCGPGTHVLASLLWLQANDLPEPERVDLVDLSKNALSGAQKLISSISKVPVRSFAENLFHHGRRSSDTRCDWLIIGHVLNEMGNGPRSRDKKMGLLLQSMGEHLKDGGIAFILEPPLREPTLDLMWIRDHLEEFGEGQFQILAPCPVGTRLCPMITHKMGWCYAQPPRTWARALGLAPWDKELEDTCEIELTKPGFSYLVIERAPFANRNLAKHKIGVSDGQAKNWACTGTDIIRNNVEHRGAYLYTVDTSVAKKDR